MKSDLLKQEGQHAQTFKKEITKTLSCKYLLFLPEGYGKEQKRWPLMLFLHGAGERGDDLNKVKVHGPPKIVETRKDFPFIVVSPQCPEDDWWTKKTEMLINLLDDIIARYDVDTQRVYLTGLSMGGYGSWALASEYPDRFAAAVPICGGGNRIMSIFLKDTPIWAFHGAKDSVVPVEESKEMVEAINARGGNAKLTIYPEANHDSWTETYNNQEVYDWLLEHRRASQEK
ncbi:MAG: prolyl oligopeptidase family serine peptidase [Sedimentisphaerales bacterium]|nr:prolyl oligopeptidase family serine peptidase [Sedimentisphaerales bacterium]